MGSLRKAKLAISAFRNIASKIIPKAPRQEFNSRIFQNGSSSSSSSSPNPVKLSSFYPYSSVSQKLGLGFQMGTKRIINNNSNPFGGSAGKRFYYVDSYQVHHFKPRGPRRWFQNPRNVLIVFLVGSGAFITVYFGNLETVPYTKRKHFVLLSKATEKKLGENEFEQMKRSFKGKILPAIHPDSVRVRLIAKDIIGALQRGLKQESVWTDLSYASAESDGVAHGVGASANETVKTLLEGEGKAETKWLKDDEILDDRWIEQSRKKGQQKGTKAETSHLDGLNWEVLVVNEPHVNAFCVPGGKIVVFTGLLEHFKTDAEIAAILAHEVGHAVARHSAEGITKNMWLVILQLILYQFIMPDLANTMSNLLLRLPFSRKMEIEADHIGVLLMASAGYDPRVAPIMLEKLGKIMGDSVLQDYLATHPSGRKRSQLLARAKVMDEAVAIYRETLSGRGVEGYFL